MGSQGPDRSRGVWQREGGKALYRLFGWADATYRIDEYPDDHALRRTIDLPVDTLIVEGMKHAGEIGALLSHLPPLDSTLVLKEDCTLPPSAYTPAELDVFQTVIRQETLVRVLESSRMTDTALLRILDGLLRKGVVFYIESRRFLIRDSPRPATTYEQKTGGADGVKGA